MSNWENISWEHLKGESFLGELIIPLLLINNLYPEGDKLLINNLKNAKGFFEIDEDEWREIQLEDRENLLEELKDRGELEDPPEGFRSALQESLFETREFRPEDKGMDDPVAIGLMESFGKMRFIDDKGTEFVLIHWSVDPIRKSEYFQINLALDKDFDESYLIKRDAHGFPTNDYVKAHEGFKAIAKDISAAIEQN